MQLWKIIPHSWMTRECPNPGGPGCRHEGEGDSFHSHDTTFWFRLAYR